MSQNIYSFSAGDDLTGMEGYAVELTSGDVTVVNSATDVPVGIIVRGDVQNNAVDVALPGTKCRGKLTGTTVRGAALKLASDGRLDPVGSAFTTNDVVIAMALEAGGANDLVNILVVGPSKAA